MKIDLKNSFSKRRLPDFIIAGAMKSGTTSLHQTLANHPDIFLSDKEIGFYDIDDIRQHPDFCLFAKDIWHYPHFEDQLNNYVNWYESFFANANENQLIGEDSTTYIASEKSPERISRLNPKAKIIVMLRDPASRTYSHYWHLVRTGRAIYNFEDSLQVMQENLIQRSLYKQQIERFLKFIPYENFYFIIFEEFIQNMQDVVEEVCLFLGVSPNKIDINKINTYYNPAKTPRSLTLQLWRNRLLRLRARRVYLSHLVEVPDSKDISESYWANKIDNLHRRINPIRQVRPPDMRPSTRNFLNYYFSNANKGLSELVNKDVDVFWYKG